MANRKNSEMIDVSAILKSYSSKWYLFVISIIFCLGVGFLFTRIHKRPMAVRANILISQEESSPLGSSSAFGMGGLFSSTGYVQDEIFVISSHSLYRNVAKALDLNKTHMVKTGFLRNELAYPDFPIDVNCPGIADTLSSSFSFKVTVDPDGMTDIVVRGGRKQKVVAEAEDVKLPYVVKLPEGDFTVSQTEFFPKGEKVKSTIYFSGYESAAEDLTSSVEAYVASKRSNVISLEFNVPNSAYGSAVLNEILKKYNERVISEQNQQSVQTAQFLEDRLKLVGADLSQAEDAIQRYKESHNIADISAEASFTGDVRKSLESQIFGQQAFLDLLKLTRDFFADSAKTTELAPAIIGDKNFDGEAINNAISEYNTMVLQRIELERTAKGDNPALARADRSLRLMRANLYKTVNRAIDKTQLYLDELLKRRAQNDAKIGDIPTQERIYKNMLREQGLKERLYNFLLQRQEENAMAIANATPKGKIVDEAYTLSEPLGVGNKLILLIALFFGIILPPVFLYFWKLIRNKFESRKEVENRITAPILGEMCVDRSGRKLVVSEHDTSSSTELFRLLRSNLQFMLSDASDRVVLVTSTVSGEGKSYISANLAASLSLLEGKRVLLVGMDIRNPQLENYLNLHPKYGLTNYLSSNDISIDQIITKMPGYDSLDVVVAGPIPPNPAELLVSKKVDELFEEMRKRYDYIVVDSAPVGMVSDTFTLDRIADATVYVTRVNYSSLSDLQFIEDIYEEKRLKKLSVVVNGTPSKKGYGYGYGRKGTKS